MLWLKIAELVEGEVFWLKLTNIWCSVGILVFDNSSPLTDPVGTIVGSHVLLAICPHCTSLYVWLSHSSVGWQKPNRW